MLQLHNEAPFTAAMAVIRDERGEDCVVLVAKATFATHPRLRLADVQREIERADRLVETPGSTCVLAAGELGLPKAGTDVLMTGHVVAPGGRPTTRGAVSLAAAERKQIAMVFGDRRWESLGRIEPPRPWVRMPITWERAFGGRGEGGSKDVVAAADRNPAGVGLADRVGDPLPNFEDPRQLVTGRGDRPPPCGFSPVAPSWEPRRRHAGTYDAAWARRRAPYLPKDFDRRFFNVAPSPLCFDRFLVGGEPVEAVGVSTREAVRFDLPRCRLRARFAIGRRWEEAPVQLQTIHLYPDDDEVTLTFAACFSAGRRLLSISQARLDLERLALEHAAA